MLPPALPGAVVTAMVEVESRATGRGKARYTIVPAPTVRLFGGTMGVVPAERRPVRVPLTFTLPRDHLAGPLLVATVSLVWDDGRRYTAELRLQVQALRHLRASLGAPPVATAGRPLLLHYRLVNLGNAADTIQLRPALPASWKVPVTPAAVVVAPGDSAAGSVRVVLPRDATRGDYAATLRAAGRADTALASAMLHVVGEYSGGGVRLPATLFVGLPDLRDRRQEPQVALMAQGELDATRLLLSLRHSDDRVRPPAFYRYTLGPEWSAAAENPHWEARAGDMMTPTGGALGVYGLGTGLSFGWRAPLAGSVFLARPREYGEAPLPGYLASGALSVTSPVGALGVRAGDYARPLRAGLPQDRTQTAALTYESGAHAGHSLTLEAGYARVSEDTLARSGPTVDASYSFAGKGGAFLMARTRRIPGLVQGGQGANDSYVGAGVPVLRGLQLTGWGASTSIPMLGAAETRHTDFAGGFRAGTASAGLQLMGDYARFTGGPLVTGGEWSQRSVRGTGNLARGRLALIATGEVGRVEAAAGELPLRSGNARLSLRTGTGSLWLGGSYTEGRFGPMPFMANAGVQAQVGGIGLDASAGAFVPQAGRPYFSQSWGTLTLPLFFRTAGVLGGEYRPWEPMGQRWRLTGGIATSFGLPVPVPRAPAAEGTVFEDANGNGRRDEDEQPVAGVTLRLGAAEATTDAEGRFRFLHGAGRRQDLAVEATSLPLGWLIGSFSGEPRRIDIPVFRTSTLRVRTLEEGAAGGAVRPAAGVWVQLRDPQGRERGVESDSAGWISFDALPAGHYTLTAQSYSERGTPLPEKVVEVDVRYGQRSEVQVAVPSGRLQIRFKSPVPPAGPPDAAGPTASGSVRIKLILQEQPDARVAARPAANVLIELVAADGRPRKALSDPNGTALLGGLPAGRYTLTIHPVGTGGEPLPVKIIPLEVRPGATRSVVVPVYTRPY